MAPEGEHSYPTLERVLYVQRIKAGRTWRGDCPGKVAT
jgi:hypothetical protein